MLAKHRKFLDQLEAKKNHEREQKLLIAMEEEDKLKRFKEKSE